MSKILIVDDDHSTRTLYQRELKEEGYRSIPASGLSEAVQLMREEVPDLVIFDLSPWEMGGLLPVSRMLTKDRVPVVFVSGYPDDGDSVRKSRDVSYVNKSSDLTELKHTVKDLLFM